MISVKNIYKDFGKLRVLNAVSCEIKDGEKVAIIGPSGSGKSTFLRCMNLLEEPTYGEIWLDGHLLTEADPYLHFDVIRKSATYAKLMNEMQDDEKVIAKIKAEDLLKKREGRAFREALSEINKLFCILHVNFFSSIALILFFVQQSPNPFGSPMRAETRHV